jgi:hypothetical protein
VNRPSFEQRAADDGSIRCQRFATHALYMVGREPVTSNMIIETASSKPNNSLVSAALSSGRFNQSLKHTLQIEGRAANDLQHIGSRRLLLQCLRKNPYALRRARACIDRAGPTNLYLTKPDAARGLGFAAARRRALVALPPVASRRFMPAPAKNPIIWDYVLHHGNIISDIRRGQSPPIDDIRDTSALPPTPDGYLE